MHDGSVRTKRRTYTHICIHTYIRRHAEVRWYFSLPMSSRLLWNERNLFSLSNFFIIEHKMPLCHHILLCELDDWSVFFSFSFLGTLMSSSNIDSTGSTMNNGTLPLRSSAYSCPNSTQLTTATMSTIDRPNSNSSNVYQTIDADRFVTSVVFFSISMFDVHYSNKHRQYSRCYLCSLSSNSRTYINEERKKESF